MPHVVLALQCRVTVVDEGWHTHPPALSSTTMDKPWREARLARWTHTWRTLSYMVSMSLEPSRPLRICMVCFDCSASRSSLLLSGKSSFSLLFSATAGPLSSRPRQADISARRSPSPPPPTPLAWRTRHRVVLLLAHLPPRSVCCADLHPKIGPRPLLSLWSHALLPLISGRADIPQLADVNARKVGKGIGRQQEGRKARRVRKAATAGETRGGNMIASPYERMNAPHHRATERPKGLVK